MTDPVYWKRRSSGRVFERCGNVVVYLGKRYAPFRLPGTLGVGRTMALHKMQPASADDVAAAKELTP